MTEDVVILDVEGAEILIFDSGDVPDVIDGQEEVFIVSVGEQGPAGFGLPHGGTTGQIAKKASNADADIVWADQTPGTPAGGTTGQLLAKASNTDFDEHWIDPPASGTWGQITGVLANQTDLATALAGKQASNANLTAIAGLASAADKLPYFNGAGTAALADFTAAGRSVVGAATQAAQRVALGLQIGVDVAAYSVTLAALAAAPWAANAMPIGTGPDTLSQTVFAPNTFAARASSGNLVAKSISDDALAFNAAANNSAMRTALGLGTAATIDLTTSTSLTAADDTHVPSALAVKTFVQNSVVGLWSVQSAIDASASPNYPASAKGDAHPVSVAGKIGGASGLAVDVGDVIICSTANAGGTQASVGADFFILEHNLAGALLGSNNLSDLTDFAAARSNLGLGSLAVLSAAPAGTLTGATLNASVVASSLTSVGTLTGGATGAGFTLALGTSTITGTLPAAQMPALTGDVTSSAGAVATTVGKINGVSLAGLATGILKNTTTTGAPSIAAAGDFPTLNQSSTGSAASLSISGQSGLLTIAGLAGTNRIKTVRDAADTILELGGSYTPTGTWTSLTMVTPVLGVPTSGTLTNCTGLHAAGVVGTAAVLTGNTYTGAEIVNLAIAATSTDGAVLATTTAATVGAQKWSPRLRLTGNAWGVTAGTSQAVDWIAEVQPVQANVPTSKLVFSSQINGGGYSGNIAFTSGGFISMADAVLISGTNKFSVLNGAGTASQLLCNAGVTTVPSTGSYGFVSGADANNGADVQWRRSAAAVMQQGAANAASPVAQTLQAQGSRSGTDSNVSGANYTITSGNGTGNSAVSTLILQSPVAVASGTGAQTMTTGMTISNAGAVVGAGGLAFPTADPHIAGRWWDNAGVLTKSAG